MAPAPAGGMDMAVGRGSRNMKDACYDDPSKAKCKEFERSDEGGWPRRQGAARAGAAGLLSTRRG